MLLCLYNRSSQAKLLKTDEADKVFNVAENKTNSITDISFLKYYFDLGLLQLYSWETFSEKFFEKFPETLCMVGQIQSVLGIATLYSRKSLEISIQRSSRAQI